MMRTKISFSSALCASFVLLTVLQPNWVMAQNQDKKSGPPPITVVPNPPPSAPAPGGSGHDVYKSKDFVVGGGGSGSAVGGYVGYRFGGSSNGSGDNQKSGAPSKNSGQ